ncbi:unnamed protein product [Heterobilharzia americana]|nr:unnamed protein product [Heterobilharzia americana]
MILYEPVKNLVLLFTFLNHYKSEIYTGIVGLENESDYFAKFCFLSTNSSIRFEFAFLEEILPLKMKTFWDSPRMWSAASQRPLVSCAKRQALLNSLSANQLFHLDPYMDGWCQRISLSDKIYNELIQSSYEETSIDWVSIMNKVITKISEYFKKSEESIEIKLPSNNITYNMTTAASTLMEMNKTESIKTTERKKSTFWFPEVLKMAWSNFKSNIDNDQQSMVISQWIYCQSANIPLIVKKPSWWFFTFDSCNEPLLNNEIKSLRKSQYTNIRNKIAYRITLRNGEYGHYFREHFSTQEFGKLEIDLVFFLFLAWLFFMATSCCFIIIVQIFYILHGYFNPFNTSLAQFFYATSISCFYASLLVLASGFTTVYRNISHNHKIIFLIISASYALINITCQISMVLTHYEVGVFSRYHSKPGYVYVGLQLFSFIAYICICLHTCVKWPDRRIYFIKFIAVSCIWFWTVPLWIIICLNHVHNWYIETLIHVWDELIHILGFIVMMIFLRPEKQIQYSHTI